MRIVRLLLILSLALPGAVAAQADSGSQVPEYQVELLLFLRDRHPGGEYWPAEAGVPDMSRALTSVPGSVPMAAPATGRLPVAAAPAARLAVSAVPLTGYRLMPHAEALRRKGLTPLLHTAWRQPVGDRDSRDWLSLNAPPVHGLVRISLGRFLHIDTDLALDGNDDMTPPIRSIDHRRMRSDELHYLDHPGFGILVMISPVAD